MSLNDTPSANRVHIGFFGMRNAGKSSVVNAVTGQDLSVVSDVPGTTTDLVSKSMEILPLGPVVLTDTPGIDDAGELGALRVTRALRAMARMDVAVLVVDGTIGLREPDEKLLQTLAERKIPCVVAWNKCDKAALSPPENAMAVSALTGEGVDALKERLGSLESARSEGPGIFEGLLAPGDLVVLVTPIDESAPKARMILPQQQALREALDRDGYCVVTRESRLEQALAALRETPKLVVTDSQAIGLVDKIVPKAIPLTTFSILMARKKGYLEAAKRGIARIDSLKDGDRILMAEGCTHHRQCNDIGTVKIPKWLREFTGKQLAFESCSGQDFPMELDRYALVVHCGGCMLNAREVRYRMRMADEQGVPFVNYGLLIAHLHGNLARSLAVEGL